MACRCSPQGGDEAVGKVVAYIIPGTWGVIWLDILYSDVKRVADEVDAFINDMKTDSPTQLKIWKLMPLFAPNGLVCPWPDGFGEVVVLVRATGEAEARQLVGGDFNSTDGVDNRWHRSEYSSCELLEAEEGIIFSNCPKYK